MTGSVLQTFYILFETNSKKVEEGTDKAKNSAKKMTGELKNADDVSKKLGDSFLGMSKAAVGAMAAVFAVGAVSQQAMKAAEYTEQLRLQAQAMDVNVAKLDALSGAMARGGGNAQAFRGALANLNNDAQQLALTGDSSLLPMMARLGVSMIGAGGKARNVMEMLPEIADALYGMSQDKAFAIGRNLGFDEATILTLMKGRNAVEEMTKRQEKLGGVNEKNSKIVHEFAKSMADFKTLTMTAALGIANIVLPVLTSISDGLTSMVGFIQDHQPFFDVFFSVIGAGLATVSGIILMSYVPAMVSAAAATLAATWPFILMAGILVAAAAGIALLADEVDNYINGQDSLIGRMIAPWDKLMDKIQSAVDMVKTAGSALANPIDTIKMMVKAKQNMDVYENSPIAAQSSAAIMAAGNSSSSKKVSIGNMTLQTQATDSEGIARDFTRALSDEVNSAIDQEDDGLLA